MNIKIIIFTTLFVVSVLESSTADTRVWTLSDGKTVEAELVSVIGGKVSLKTMKGKIVKISETDISDEDRLYIELAMPPKLDLSISKNWMKPKIPIQEPT